MGNFTVARLLLTSMSHGPSAIARASCYDDNRVGRWQTMSVGPLVADLAWHRSDGVGRDCWWQWHRSRDKCHRAPTLSRSWRHQRGGRHDQWAGHGCMLVDGGKQPSEVPIVHTNHRLKVLLPYVQHDTKIKVIDRLRATHWTPPDYWQTDNSNGLVMVIHN